MDSMSLRGIGERNALKNFGKSLSGFKPGLAGFKLERLFEKSIPITTENLAINFDDFGRPSLTLIGDYFKASKEVADLVGKLAVSDTDKALELEGAFSSVKSCDDSYLFKAADFLEVRYKEITPLQSLFDNKWQEAEEEAKLILADQLRNYFTICKVRGDAKTFSQFADEVKRIYKGLARDAIEIASQSLGEDFLRLANQEEKKSRNKKLILGLSALGLIAASSLGAYLYKQHLENQKKEEAKRPYKQAGLSDEQAEEFIASYPKQNGNSTWVNFAKSWANDRALAEESLKIFGSLKDSLDYFYFANSNGYDGLNFLKDFPQFAKNYTLVLPAYSANSTLVKIVYDQFQRDPRINLDRNDLFLKGLKEYQDLNLIKKNLMIQTVQALNNLTLAYEKGLPRLDNDSVWLLTNATQISKDIVDFEPVIVKDVDGNKIVIQSQNLSRDYWMIANLLKERPALASQAKKFEWLNKMIQQVAWDIFDYEYGPKYFDKKSYKPNDPEVWQVILGFHDYMDALPAKLEKDGIGVIIPYHDSDLLRSSIPDKANRTIALFYLADLPAKTVNQTYAAELRRLAQERKITSGEYDRLYNEKAVVKGIEGMKLFVEQLPTEYEEIRRLYPNGKVYAWGKERDIRSFYYSWLADRAMNGLDSTVKQFIGLNYNELSEIMRNYDNWEYEVSKHEGINQFLSKNWKPWDLVKFIYSYESFKAGDWGGEAEMYAYGLPLAYKAFGIPLGSIGGSPYIFGTMGGEWAVPLPNNVIAVLKQAFPNSKMAIGYGNLVGMYSCIDGLEKDGITEIRSGLRGNSIYLWKK
jgi:hypothetical protein